MTRKKRRPVRFRWSLRGTSLLCCLGAPCLAQEPPSAELLLRDLGCGACHDGVAADSNIRDKAPDLTYAGFRYRPDYLLGFLRYPVRVRQNLGYSRMPNFQLDERESLALTLFLAEQITTGTSRPDYGPQEAVQQARALYPDVTAQLGEQIFRALNCVACHKQSSVKAPTARNAPGLGIEGARVTREWLAAYLRAPTPIRRGGFFPGTGSRHPDFRLSESEVQTLTTDLLTRRGAFDSLPRSFNRGPLLAFSSAKAEQLLKDKLPCLGCHRLGSEGGIVGPDLSSLSARLQPEFVYQMIRDPRRVMPTTVMPQVEMPAATLDLIVNYLVQQNLPRERAPYLSLVTYPPQFPEGLERGRRLHVTYCAPCHGTSGDSAGYNAAFLPVPPARHADSSAMARRPDDTLFDGIYAGGYVLDKSARMPPWGATLERRDIRELVHYIRQLCRCSGPSWSRDNR